ncbi:tetratricopeptide repeat protein [Anaerohalosphaera lusitana]|uniref:Tetratricopeptide repeat protein n=1 Tax=Anaerohalosphaera lusitana TaxID=1936003 RepID=A0A1U9NG59_9BACT|nr:tetratricopeptide repeat protein [Anaerohalosphaera lusitana]AQT66913.1 tetratricopeptide repeat protein [Anaerohalosphaera lusitana]
MENNKSKSYQKGLELAEQGKHDQALELISEHLETSPDDLEALNDKGAILFCMGKTDEAIQHFEQARQVDEDCPQVYWNLAEAYLSANRPEQAKKQFEKMDRLSILNCDLLNRTANQFLQNENCEQANEMLEWSLKMTPDQEILKPMIEIIQSRQNQQ